MMSDRVAATLAGIAADDQLLYENYQVVSLVQALLGAITPNMVAISIRCVGEVVHLYFYLEQESEADREEISDVEFELLALQLTNVPIHAHVSVIGQELPANGVEGRMVYVRHAPPHVGL